MEYFRHIQLNAHLICIIGLDETCFYLVNGSEKTVLLDAGSGYGDLKSYIEENKLATHDEIDVIVTHGHHDHIGGADSFNKIYMNHKDLKVFKEFGTMESRLNYTHEFEERMGIKFADSMLPMTKKTLLPIEDYQVFDLGDIHIKMIPVAGHTPGMMCPLIEEDRICIFGDACGVSVLLMGEYSSNVSEYKQSLLNLKKFENDYDTIYRNHGSYVSPKELLDNVIECCDLILEHKDAHQPVKMHGMDFFAAHKVEGYGRADGKEGNIFYEDAKAK